MKNLGNGVNEISKMYGTGTNVDQLVSTNAELTYNVPHWKLGVEYNLTSAWYGSMKSSNGKIIDTHSVSNNRLVATVFVHVLKSTKIKEYKKGKLSKRLLFIYSRKLIIHL